MGMSIQQLYRLRKAQAANKAIPSIVPQLNDTVQRGPNCWNATILFFDKNESVRHVTQEEMVKWLTFNTKADPYRRCEPGSIVALYVSTLIGNDSLHNDLIHTAVWIAPGFLWHKYGCAHRWEIVSEKELRRKYPEANHWEYLQYDR